MPRVVMVGPNPDGVGGVGAAARNFLDSEALRSRFDIQYLTSWSGGPFWRKAWDFIQCLTAFVICARRSRAHIVHFHVAHGVSVARKAVLARIAVRRGLPYLVQLHSGLIEYTANRNALQHRWVLRLLDAARAVVILYEGARPRTESLTTNSHIMVLPNPIPLESEPMMSPLETRQVGLPRPVRMLFLGDVTEDKGVVDLLHAMTVIEACSAVSVELDICGSGEVDRMRRLSQQLYLQDVVRFHGWVERSSTEDLMQAADIYVHPSHNDELPMAVLEALAAGRPVVATQVGGMGEAVLDGENGFLVTPNRPDRLAQAIRQLVEDSQMRARMGQRSRQLARERFGVEAVAKQLLEVYRFCLDEEAHSLAC